MAAVILVLVGVWSGSRRVELDISFGDDALFFENEVKVEDEGEGGGEGGVGCGGGGGDCMDLC